MKKILFMSFSLILINSIYSQKNPLFTNWNTPYGVPPFETINPEHFMPAFQAGFAEEMADVWKIIRNQDEPDFENTIVAFDMRGELLRKINPVFFGITSIANNDQLQQIARELSPMRSKHNDDISLNPLLFEKIKYVYDNKGKLNLNTEQNRLLENTYKSFVRNGALLSAEKQAKLRKVNSELATVQLKFSQNVLAETADFKLKISDIKKLDGLTSEIIEDAKSRAVKAGEPDLWYFGLDNPSVMPFLENAKSRELRTQILNAYLNRGNNGNDKDNKENIKKILSLRMERSQLLGYRNYAEYAIEERMSANPDIVMNFLNKLWKPSLNKAKSELKDIEKMMKKDKVELPVTPSDWRYYATKASESKFQLNENDIKPYFPLNQVREGIFYVANRLYGITFKEVKNIPLPHNEATAWQCNDKDGSILGIVYLDMHPRPGQKNGGAWCGTYRSQSYSDSGEKIFPIVTIACNFSRPVGGKPALLTTDEVNTFFHEFGHGLHNLFKDTRYQGTGRPQNDFIEFPSQVMEHWAIHPEVLKIYAKHYENGKPLPEKTIKKLIQKEMYGQGFATTEYMAASLLDMEYHMLETIPEKLDIEKFEQEILNKYGLISQIPPRYRSTYFGHTFSGGYSAGYYMYIWAEQLDSDAFEAFTQKNDIFDPVLSGKLRSEILSRGGIEDAMILYKNFRGKEPDVNALLRNRGL